MTREIPLTRGKVAVVDDCDYELLSSFKWYAYKGRNTFYAVRGAWNGNNNNKVLMHRVILDAPAGMEVDHVDHNGLNNARDNIRLAMGSQNQANRGKTSSNTSGFKGVYWDARRSKWKAEIQACGHGKHLGYFDDPSDAACAYDEAARQLHGEFASTNFSRGGSVLLSVSTIKGQ